MKIIALEEHAVPRQISEAWTAAAARQGLRLPQGGSQDPQEQQLEDLGERRLKDMEDSGVDVQVLSVPSFPLHDFDPSEAVPLAVDSNDLIASVVAGRPDKFEAFATLPVTDPRASASELERAVTKLGLKGALLCGRIGDRNMDHRDFDAIYEAAAHLQVPLYIHPGIPNPAVVNAYYTGFSPKADALFARNAIGWHYETGIQALRMVMAGVFDRHPKLQIILGHWGEIVFFYLDRISDLDATGLALQRPIRSYFLENVYYTPSGIFSETYLRWTLDLVGAGRIMFSQDYPYRFSGNRPARVFLEEAVVPPADKEKIAHKNWEALSSRGAHKQHSILGTTSENGNLAIQVEPRPPVVCLRPNPT